MKISGILLGSVLAVASVATVAAEPAPAAAAAKVGDSTLSIHEFRFSPTSMTVPVGTTVRWKNLDGEPHTVRGVDGSFASGALDQNDSFTFKFAKPGTYKYVCSIHPQMVGTIVVK